jgi:predicted component of type VI protein secretion system
MTRRVALAITAVAALAGITLAAVPAHAAVNWKARTCSAATAYQRHPGAARLTTLVTDSTHLGKSYLRADVGQLYADASSPSPKAVKYAVKDIGYIRDDCAQ